ncbi:MAG: hypothetical protein KDD21_11430 [Bacteroidetes bacterium]|nr:hypothetical protein [Bacteroidota bacterium]
MKQFIFILIVSMFILSFAGKPPKINKQKNKEWVVPTSTASTLPKGNIYGHWVWIETDCCGARHGISTPQSTLDSIVLIINADNTFDEKHTTVVTVPRNGNVITYVDGTNNMIQFNDERPARFMMSPDGDTMTISWKYLEMQTEIYVRKK